MKIAPRAIEGFLDRPDPKVRATLLYGPDSGLIRERAERLIRALMADSQDPFGLCDLGEGQVRADPALLHDECAALSLGGGRRVVRVRDATDALAEAATALLAAPPAEAALILLAADLSPRSRLRKAFEKAANAAAVPCYLDDQKALPALIRDTLSAEGVDISPDAVTHLAANLGADRQLTRRELEKLALDAGPGARVELADVTACFAEGAAQTLDALAFAIAGGDMRAVDRGLARVFAEGVGAVGILRATARHFQRLLTAVQAIEQGAGTEDAVRRLQPPVFWKQKPAFLAQTRTWSSGALLEVGQKLLEGEALCKQTGVPDQAVAWRTVTEIAGSAPLGRGPAVGG